MKVNVGKQVAAMKRMTTRQLRGRYEEVFGEACRSCHKRWLIKRIAWRLQTNEEGDLSERTRRRAAAVVRLSAHPYEVQRPRESVWHVEASQFECK